MPLSCHRQGVVSSLLQLEISTGFWHSLDWSLASTSYFSVGSPPDCCPTAGCLLWLDNPAIHLLPDIGTKATLGLLCCWNLRMGALYMPYTRVNEKRKKKKELEHSEIKWQSRPPAASLCNQVGDTATLVHSAVNDCRRGHSGKCPVCSHSCTRLSQSRSGLSLQLLVLWGLSGNKCITGHKSSFIPVFSNFKSNAG